MKAILSVAMLAISLNAHSNVQLQAITKQGHPIRITDVVMESGQIVTAGINFELPS